MKLALRQEAILAKKKVSQTLKLYTQASCFLEILRYIILRYILSLPAFHLIASDRISKFLKYNSLHLLQADFSVSSSGETYCAVPTNEFARAVKKIERDK